MDSINFYKVIGASLMTFLTSLIGGWDLSLQVLLIAIVIDILAGMCKGAKNGELSSKRIREGVMTKSAYLLVLVLVYQFDLLVGNSEPVFRTVATWLYIFTETVSVFENLHEMGVPIPKKLYDVLIVIKDKSGGFMTDSDFEELKKETDNTNNDNKDLPKGEQ